MEDQKKKLVDHVFSEYTITQDRPFEKFPEYSVFRHPSNKKWFALFMPVPYETIGISKPGVVWIVDVKVHKDTVGTLRQVRGVLPAYHMNKEHWISVLLDGTLQTEQLCLLIDESYNLTAN